MRECYIIIAYNSEGAINVNKMFGTREEIQEQVLKMITEDRIEDEENWDMGTENVYELDYDGAMNGFSGYNTFYGYSINYVACPYTDIPEVK